MSVKQDIKQQHYKMQRGNGWKIKGMIAAWNSIVDSLRIFAKIYTEFRYEYCRQTFNISRTKSQNSNVSRLVLLLSLPNPLKQGVKSRMKMYLGQHRHAMR